MPRQKSMQSMASGGEYLNHFNAVRMRVTGSGELDMILYSLDDVNSVILEPLTLSATTNREPTRLTNMTEQRAALEISMDEIDEWFMINRIVVFAKPVFNDYPM